MTTALGAAGHPAGSRLGRRELLPLAVLGLIAVLGLGVAAGLSSANESEINRSQAVMRETQALVSGHATAMRDLARRTGVGAAADNRASTAVARRLDEGVQQLENLALLLGNQATLMGPHPGQSFRSDLGFVHSTGDSLVVEGNAVIAHGRSMREEAAAPADISGPSITGDAALLQQAGDQLIDAGERARNAGRLLQQAGAQFMRSLGR